jgi:hypothetical protein
MKKLTAALYDKQGVAGNYENVVKNKIRSRESEALSWNNKSTGVKSDSGSHIL